VLALVLKKNFSASRKSQRIKRPQARPPVKSPTRVHIKVELCGEHRPGSREVRDCDGRSQEVIGASPMTPVGSFRRQKSVHRNEKLTALNPDELYPLNLNTLSGLQC
jgi:hypothetical protein